MFSDFLLRNRQLVVFFLFIGTFTHAQSGPSAWGSIFVSGPFRKQWGLHLDVQVRSTNGMDGVKGWLFRPGLHVQLNKRHWLTMGYAYVFNQTNSPGIRTYLPEHRLWQQWTHLQHLGRLQLQHRLRIEERFIGSTRYTEGAGIPTSPSYSTRFRYFNRLLIPTVSTKSFTKGAYGCIQNEVFLHLTGNNNLNGKTFDQNRAYLALGYRFNKQLDAECGYMLRNIGTTSSSVNQHTWQIAVYLRPQ
ncbi:MAG: DUF2490 domain-containing protein [Bacteroidota bacterium]